MRHESHTQPKSRPRPIHAPVGAVYQGNNRALFRVWAPMAQRMAVVIEHPAGRDVEMNPEPGGWHSAIVDGAPPGARYRYRLNGDKLRPDPASRYQPEGVHGPSEVVDPAFDWTDAEWRGLPLSEYIIYELHVGTFTPEGTFEATIARLDRLLDLGVTAVELMPVAQFPGGRNWGYDGVYPFAAQNTYGGPQGLRKLVSACHRKGLAVALDVVYNHLGPEGNYLWDYGPYFTDRYRTPWGEAVNFDGPDSDAARAFFIENARWWTESFHIDALRLDAIHAIYDFSARHILAELADAMAETGRRRRWPVHLIAESDMNDPRIIRPRAVGGYGLDAQWSDDFHHSAHALLTGESDGYYVDFGRIAHLEKAFSEGFVISGGYSEARRRRHGASSRNAPARRLVVCAQNHDQVGNRMRGERLCHLVHFEKQKLAAGLTLLSPFVPLLFMGEEYAETAPFPYFVSHGDPDLAAAVRQGRAKEFAAFKRQSEPPDPADPATFESARLHPDLAKTGEHAVLYRLYRRLIRARKDLPELSGLSKKRLRTWSDEALRLLRVDRWEDGGAAVILFYFGDGPLSTEIPFPDGEWVKWLDSADAAWGGPGGLAPARVPSNGRAAISLPPHSFALWRRKATGDGPYQTEISHPHQAEQ